MTYLHRLNVKCAVVRLESLPDSTFLNLCIVKGVILCRVVLEKRLGSETDRDTVQPELMVR